METVPLHDHVKALGEGKTEYAFDKPRPDLLEKFPSPFSLLEMNPAKVEGFLKIVCPEFTSLCPKTGQPDFAQIVITYVPKNWCVESKSLKLYLGSFRNHGEFHESCVNRIANDLVALLDPWELRVRGEFTPRGGIPFWPTASYFGPSNEDVIRKEFEKLHTDAHDEEEGAE